MLHGELQGAGCGGIERFGFSVTSEIVGVYGIPVGQTLVNLHAFALGCRSNEGIEQALLQTALHDVEFLPSNSLAEEGLMHHIHHLHSSEGTVAILPLILIHTHQTLVGEEIPQDVVLLILQKQGWFLFGGAVGSVAQRIDHLGDGRAEKPLLITEHVVEEELHGCLLTSFLYMGVSCRKVGRTESFRQHRAIHIDAADIGKDMIEVQAPLVNDSAVEVGCLVVSLVGVTVACPVHDIGHDTLEILDAEVG